MQKETCLVTKAPVHEWGLCTQFILVIKSSQDQALTRSIQPQSVVLGLHLRN